MVVPIIGRGHAPIEKGKEPFRVTSMSLLIGAECSCGGPDRIVALVNHQPAACPSCGAVVSMDSLSWEKGNPVPHIALSVAPSRKDQLSATN